MYYGNHKYLNLYLSFSKIFNIIIVLWQMNVVKMSQKS